MAALCILLAASSAFAKKRVVVLDFKGPQSGKAEAAVISAMKKRHTVVSASQYTKAEKRLKAKKQTSKNVAKVAAEIQVDAVVTGVVKKKGGKWTLTVSVREGTTGKVKGTAKIALRAPRIDQRAKDDIESEVVSIVDNVESISGAGGDSGGAEIISADEGRGKKGKKPPVEEEPAEEPSGDESGEEEAAPGVDDGSNEVASNQGGGEAGGESSVSKSTGDDDGIAEDIVGGKYARNGAFQVDAGISAIARSLTFNTRSTLAANQQPNGYDGAIVPGVMIDGAVYPLAFGDPTGALAGVGVTFVFDRVFVLKSKYGTEEYNTTQQRFGLGLRYRLNIGNRPTLPTVHAGIGYNSLSFVIDSGAAVIGLPDVSYSYLDPGVGVRFPLGTPSFALTLDAKYMLMLSQGEFSEQKNYGCGSVAGTDLDGGVEWRLMPRMPLRLGVRYVRIAYDFDGTGMQTTNLDGDPSSKDVGGALDEYFGGYVTAGYIF